MHLPSFTSSSRYFFLLLAFLAGPIAAAQDGPHPCATADGPADLTLRLSLNNGQTIFREGEIIALTAEYSSTQEKKYSLSTRGYDRSGRLVGTEEFCLNPARGEDPVADYFNGIGGFMGGGLSSELDPGSRPFSVSLELNEWLTLPVGSYRLSIEGHRVVIPSEDGPYAPGARPVPIRSNEVEFQVVKAEPAWQAEQLAAAEHALDSSSPSGEEAKHAARVLRFLGSEASTREIARRFWSSNDQPFGWDLKFGLYGSPFRSIVISAMRSALKDSQHPVTQDFIQNLATLELQSDPKMRLPIYDQQNQEAWNKARAAYDAAMEKHVSGYMSEAAAVLQSKTGRARAVSVSELLQSDSTLSPAAIAQLRQLLLASWDSLPIRKRNELIQYRWEQVGGSEFLPVLRAIVAGEPNRNHDLEKPDRGAALRRIYELAPDQGRELILREVASPKGDIDIGVLGMLPDHELPQLDQTLIANLQGGAGSDLSFQLVSRYASLHALPVVRGIYEPRRGEWACNPQGEMLRYFLRVSPEYGISEVRDALSQRQKTSCYMSLFSSLGEGVRLSKIESIATSALNDTSLEVTTDSAEALGKYGSSKAEAPLWKRMEKLHESEMKPPNQSGIGQTSLPNQDLQRETRLEQVLTQAIVSGHAWFVTADSVEKLKEISSSQMQPELDGELAEIRRGDYSLTLNWWPDGTLSYTVGWYSGKGMAGLKEKLAQFPPGTHLEMVTTIGERNQHQSEFGEVADAAAAGGLVLEIQTPR